MKKPGLLLLAACMMVNGISAQTDDYASNLIKVLPLSPNAASLGKFGELPVGYYTGIPNISVPVYTIEVGDIKVPLNLNYHAGGVKVEDIASWVGMGWSFAFGGSISRQMRGLADESGGGYMTTYEHIDQFNSWTTAEKEAYIEDTKQGTRDSQNDIFNYSFGNQSGKFFFVPDIGFITKPRNRIKFELGTFFGQSGWKVVNTDGLVYYFLDKEETTNIASSLPISGDPVTAVSTWYISKIISAEGKDSVVFEYDVESVSYESNLSQTINLVESPSSLCSQRTSFSTSLTSVLGKRLKKVKFRNGEISVIAMTTEREDLPGSHALQSIQIKNSLNNEVKRLDFFYTTVSASSGQATSKRLFLDSINISANNLSLSNYQFEYESRHLLPDRRSSNQDFWGYFNGANNNVLMPNCFFFTVNDTFPYSGADRSPNSLYTNAGTLKKIQYPTGGSTELVMENNTVSNLLSVIEPGYDLKDTTMRFQIFGDGAGSQTSYAGNFSVTNGFAGTGGVMAKIQIGLPNSGALPPPPIGPDDPVIQLTKPDGSHIFLRNNITTFLRKGNYTVNIDFSANPDPDLIRDFYIIIDYEYGVTDNPAKLKNCIAGGLRLKTIKDVDPVSGIVYERTFNYIQDDGITSTGVLGSFPAYKGYLTTCQAAPVDYCSFITHGSVPQSSALLTQGSYVGYSMVDELIDAGNNGKNRYQYTTATGFNDQGNFQSFPYPPADSRDEFRGILLKQQVFKKIFNTNNYTLLSEKSFQYDFGVAYSVFDTLRVMIPGLSFRKIYSPTDACPTTSSTILHVSSDFFTTSGFIRLLSDTNRTYDPDNKKEFLQVVNAYDYSGENLQVNKVSTYKSTGDISEVTHKFPLDYSYTLPATDNKVKGVNYLVEKHKINESIETSEYIGKDNGPLQIVQSTFKSFDAVVGKPDTIFTLDRYGPLSNFSPAIVQSNTLKIDNRYSPKLIFNKYSENGNLLQQQKADDMPKAYIWGYNNSLPIAEITNAELDRTAYTSFESADYGRWTLNAGSAILTNNANITGSKSLNGGVNITVPHGNYILSLWSVTTPSLNGQPFPVAAKKNPGTGRFYYEVELTNITSINISGSNIDEVRLYPKGAQMITLTYDPLIGVTSKCDAKGYINYFEYDAAGRLSVLRNEDGQIVKTFDYHYMNQH